MGSSEDRPRRPVIAPYAWRIWENRDFPILLTDLVDELLALPPHLREERRLLRPPGIHHLLTGTVRGRRFTLTGVKDAEGRWIEILHVKET